MIWTRDQVHVIHTHLTVFSESEKTFYTWCPKDINPASLLDDLARRNERHCFFSVSLSRANIFFKAEILGYDAGGLRFRFPDKVFKVQRRKDLRLSVPDGHIIKISFQDPLFPESNMVKKALDISAGGAAILVTEGESPVFVPGLILKNMSFQILERKIECEAEVRYSSVLPVNGRHKGCKVGVQFQKMRAADTQAIASYVFEESRKYFTRFI